MSRIQLALNVDDLEAAVDFYAKLFGVEPAKRRPGYANFAVADPPLKLVLMENPEAATAVNHLGVEVGSTDAVGSEERRLAELGIATTPAHGICCYAAQEKVWVEGAPGGERWEIYTVLADSDTFCAEDADSEGRVCCSSDTSRAAAPAAHAAPEGATACC